MLRLCQDAKITYAKFRIFLCEYKPSHLYYISHYHNQTDNKGTENHTYT